MSYYIYTIAPGLYEILCGRILKNKKIWTLEFISVGITKKDFESYFVISSADSLNAASLYSINEEFPYRNIDRLELKIRIDINHVNDVTVPIKFKAKVFNKTGDIHIRKDLVIDNKQYFTPSLNHRIRLLKRYYPKIYKNVVFPERLSQ